MFKLAGFVDEGK